MSHDRLYSKTHEWVHVEKNPSGEKVATVGLTAFALEALTDCNVPARAEALRAIALELERIANHHVGGERVRGVQLRQ